MSKKALEDHKHEVIKAHMLDPDNSPLEEHEKRQLGRIISMTKLLDRQPIQRNAVRIHMQKYKEISRSQAYEDCRIALKIFNTLQKFDYDFWHTWLLNDIVKNIERCRRDGGDKALRVIALEHANLIRALGERPLEVMDPKLTEKHTFLIQMQINNQAVNVDFSKLMKLPADLRKELSDAIMGDIDDVKAEEIMNS